MELLKALGITYLAFIQFFIFVALFWYLTFYVFIPYFRAFTEREKLTKGGVELADELATKTTELHSTYQVKAREVNTQIQGIFQKSKAEGTVEYERVIGKARMEAQQEIEDGRRILQGAIQTTTRDLQGQTHQVALMITQKLLGKS